MLINDNQAGTALPNEFELQTEEVERYMRNGDPVPAGLGNDYAVDILPVRTTPRYLLVDGALHARFNCSRIESQLPALLTDDELLTFRRARQLVKENKQRVCDCVNTPTFNLLHI